MNKSGYKSCFYSKTGFTLIELLVVVLIIGILAAVAVPQYQKAVLKSRYATLKPIVNSVAVAQDVYFLANDQYANTFGKLDIGIGGTPNGTDTARTFSWGYCVLEEGSVGVVDVVCGTNTDELAYKYRFPNKEKSCYAKAPDNGTSLPHQVCKGETGRSTYNGSAYVDTPGGSRGFLIYRYNE